MKRIKQQIDIERSQYEVFDLTQDYSKRLDWDPYLVEARLIDAESAALGVDSYCKNRSGSAMISRYISFNRPEVAAVAMIRGPKILNRFSGAWNVKRLSETRCRLVFTYNFELIGGFAGRMFLPVASWLFARDMNKRLVAIKHYIES